MCWLRIMTYCIVSFLIGVCTAHSATEITVSAAISLKNAFEEIARLCESRNSEIKVLFNFGASGDLANQIEGGAPVVLIQPASSKLEINGFEALVKPDVKMIAIGNPQTVPAGRYSQEVFMHLKIWDNIKDKLILAENVRQVLDYVVNNEVDAGVVYATDAKVRDKDVRIIAKAPEDSHKPIVYPIAMVAGSKHAEQANAFIEFILSKDGIQVLQNYGFESAQ